MTSLDYEMPQEKSKYASPGSLWYDVKSHRQGSFSYELLATHAILSQSLQQKLLDKTSTMMIFHLILIHDNVAGSFLLLGSYFLIYARDTKILSIERFTSDLHILNVGMCTNIAQGQKSELLYTRGLRRVELSVLCAPLRLSHPDISEGQQLIE